MVLLIMMKNSLLPKNLHDARVQTFYFIETTTAKINTPLSADAILFGAAHT